MLQLAPQDEDRTGSRQGKQGGRRQRGRRGVHVPGGPQPGGQQGLPRPLELEVSPQLLTPVSLRPLWMVLLALDAHSLSASSRPQHGTLSTDHLPPSASKPALNPPHHDSLSFLTMYYFLSDPGEVIRRNTKKGRTGTFEVPGIFSVHGEAGRKLEEEFLLLGAGVGGLQILSGEAKGVPEIESYR